jgi:hypothetical protein
MWHEGYLSHLAVGRIQLPQRVVITPYLPLAMTENLLLPFNGQLNRGQSGRVEEYQKKYLTAEVRINSSGGSVT